MADSLSKIGSILESARDLTLEAANTASSRLMEDSPLEKKDIAPLLESRYERDVLSGMKHIVNVSAFSTDNLYLTKLQGPP
jgi:hypothetical protein